MAVTDCYRILDSTSSLRSPSKAIADILRHVLGGFAVPANSPIAQRYVIENGLVEGAFAASVDGCRLGDYASLFDLVSVLEQTLLDTAVASMPGPGIHASAATRNGRTLLIAGDPGSGKSSLVLGLLLTGWTFLSDEVAPVGPQTARVGVYARSPWIKPGGMPLFAELDRQGLLCRPQIARPIGGGTCVTPTAFPMAPAGETFRVSSVVFPSAAPGEPARLEHVSRTRALGRLMDLTFNRNRLPDGGLGLLGDLVAGADCYTLTSGSLRGSIDAVLPICE